MEANVTARPDFATVSKMTQYREIGDWERWRLRATAPTARGGPPKIRCLDGLDGAGPPCRLGGTTATRDQGRHKRTL